VLGFVASSPYFRKDGEIAPNFAKNLTVPSFADVSWHYVKTGKYSFDRRMSAVDFSETYASLPLPVLEEAWWTRCASFISEGRCRFTIVRQMAPLPSGRSAAIENDVIAAIFL